MRRKISNVNGRFMLINCMLGIAVLFVAFFFLYVCFRRMAQQEQDKPYPGRYTIELATGFKGANFSVMINDSLLYQGMVTTDSMTWTVNRLADENTLLVVDGTTDELSLFELPTDGGKVTLNRNEQGEISKQ